MNKILQGDCLDIMKDIDNDTFDIVVSSPPYNIGMNVSLSISFITSKQSPCNILFTKTSPTFSMVVLLYLNELLLCRNILLLVLLRYNLFLVIHKPMP